ncbi:heat-inducible transcriptional repressor HrcA [Mycoplasma iguanae]|uniref:Heat-inducible transcription repressor HrcA n=1 Tax=Mycoplasma iguanae TaxID=292461 RepID=A0ABY5RB91_9MOLU|nr:heat-inducible transcriptional repressor HrcA [Mycoplasma iguanae]UVD81612.1 heat-inducible transcriptional repressor HrcA [Mycoplasma iguanae]
MSKTEDRIYVYLKMIVEAYIKMGEPVGSMTLKEIYQLDISTALIRNIMSQLEKEGYLEKKHTSGGRIPSTKGLEYYAKYLVDDNEKHLLEQIEDVFAKRRISINATIDESVKIISEIAGLTMITSSDNSNELLKSIQLTVLDDFNSIIVLVTSTGRVESKMLKLQNNLLNNDDVRIAIRLFKDRLINVPLIELHEKVQLMAPILASQVKNYESLIQHFVSNIFTFSIEYKNKIYNKNSLILSKDISRERLIELLDLVETNSIWQSIEGKMDEDDTLKIDIQDDKISLISKKLEWNNDSNLKEISFVGTNRLDYSKALTAIKFIEQHFSKKNKGE